MTPGLETKDIDTWLLPISDWTHQDLSEAIIEELLSTDELKRFNRFRPISKKDEFVASRLLLRHLLHRYTQCDIKKTEAIPDEMGRPFWVEDGKPIDLFFSLSHTRNMICCTVSRTREIGCDIESLQPRKYERDLTERVFSKKEIQHYQNLPEHARSEFFYRSWTLKEAFIKAVGQGLRVPLTSLSFTYLVDSGTTFTVAPKHLGGSWTTTPYFFKSAIPAPGYSLAIASPISAPIVRTVQNQIIGKNILATSS